MNSNQSIQSNVKQMTDSSVDSARQTSDCHHKEICRDLNEKKRKLPKEISYPHINEQLLSSLPGPSYYLPIEKVLSLIYPPKKSNDETITNEEHLKLVLTNAVSQSSKLPITNTVIDQSFIPHSSIYNKAQIERINKPTNWKIKKTSDLYHNIDNFPQTPSVDDYHDSPESHHNIPVNTTQNMKSYTSPSKDSDQSKETETTQFEGMKTPIKHRATCHRCGNMRDYTFACTECPYVFCIKCVDKMEQEHGKSTFVKGCPVCKSFCCCADKSENCKKIHHCYKKCPTTINPNYIRPSVLAQRVQCKAFKRKSTSPMIITNSSPADNMYVAESFGKSASGNILLNDYNTCHRLDIMDGTTVDGTSILDYK